VDQVWVLVQVQEVRAGEQEAEREQEQAEVQAGEQEAEREQEQAEELVLVQEIIIDLDLEAEIEVRGAVQVAGQEVVFVVDQKESLLKENLLKKDYDDFFLNLCCH